MSKKTDWLATAQASESKDFRAKNPHLFGGHPSEITTANGLLYQYGEIIPLPRADSVAASYGFKCAEQLVRHLASNAQPTSQIPPKKAGKRRKEMNKTEARFAALLDAKVARGEIFSWAYEEITLRWPDGMRYTPDFVVIVGERNQLDIEPGTTVLIEVKGAFGWAKDIVKFRAARDKWAGRFKFEFWQFVDGDWIETR